MNPQYFGDSYDIVKRFFCTELKALGYQVHADPMFTGDWNGEQDTFLRFIGTSVQEHNPGRVSRTAIFLDPDTGVHRKATRKHVSLSQVASAASAHSLAFAFDQSFSRQQKPAVAMREKLAYFTGHSCHAMYFNSHAKFLFAANEEAPLQELRGHMVSLGLPASRFVGSGGI